MLSSFRSDLVWTGNEYLKLLLQRDFGVPRVQVINPLFEDGLVEKAEARLLQTEAKKTFRGNLRFDGDFALEAERANLEFFLDQVWPELTRRLPTASLDIFGPHLDGRLLQQCLKHRRVRPVVGTTEQGRLTLSESAAHFRPKHVANVTSLLYPGPSRW